MLVYSGIIIYFFCEVEKERMKRRSNELEGKMEIEAKETRTGVRGCVMKDLSEARELEM